MAGSDIGEQGRGDKMSACRRALDDLALRGQFQIGALGDKFAHDRLLPLGDERADVEVFIRRADLERTIALSHPLDDFAINLTLDENAGGGGAGLARILYACIDQERECAVEVGVGEHELGRFAAEFEGHRRDMARGRSLDERPDCDRAGEGKMPDPGVGGERRAGHFAEARHDIERARRKARLAREIGERQRSQAGLLGGLQHARVAHRQRRADGAPGDLHRIVPRHDMAGHPMRLA